MTNRKKIITFIVNPISGTQGKEQILKLISERLDLEKYDYEVIKTEYAGHAAEIAHDCVELQREKMMLL